MKTAEEERKLGEAGNGRGGESIIPFEDSRKKIKCLHLFITIIPEDTISLFQALLCDEDVLDTVTA